MKKIGVIGKSRFSEKVFSTIEKYGALPLHIVSKDWDKTMSCIQMCNGIVMTGGVDIHPAIYNQPVTTNKNYSSFDISRDKRELKIIDYLVKNKVPSLMICRSHQMLTGVYHGAGIIQDISDSITLHAPNEEICLNEWEPAHFITIDNMYIECNSYHHQAVPYEQGKEYPFDVIGTAVYDPYDGEEQLINELSVGPKWVSTQFHPEVGLEKLQASQMAIQIFWEML